MIIGTKDSFRQGKFVDQCSLSSLFLKEFVVIDLITSFGTWLMVPQAHHSMIRKIRFIKFDDFFWQPVPQVHHSLLLERSGKCLHQVQFTFQR